MARPAKITASLIQDICTLVSAGVSIADACASKGISRSTLYLWAARGQRGEADYAEFAHALYEAQAKSRAGVTLSIMQAAKLDWRAGAWWLERRDPAYSPKAAATNQELMQTLIDCVQPHMSIGAFGELLDALAKLAGDAGVAGQQTDAEPLGTFVESRRLDSGDDPD